MVVLRFIKRYAYNLLIGVDQLINAVLTGDPDETISSRVGRVFPNTWLSDVIDFIMFYQLDHCYKAIEDDEGKRDLLFPAKRKKDKTTGIVV